MKQAVRVFALSLMVAFAAACSKEPPQQGPQPQQKEQEGEPWPEGSTVVGTVTAAGKPIEGVVVSDGYITTATDSRGRYSLASAKKHGYVFISTPSGYQSPTAGVQPQFYIYVGKHTRDTANFFLSASDQSEYSVYLLGDIHLADKRRDLVQFADFAADLNSLRDGRNGFALTLGDMSWDAYWSDFDLKSYLAQMNRTFPGLRVYHTIGNHDHELNKAGDWDTAVTYKAIMGPTYYSFNAGGVHFVVLDDILCRNTVSGTRDSWNEVDADQLAWLKKDLSYIQASTPVVVTMHAPLYSRGGSFYLYNGMDLVRCFSNFGEVYFFSGHTHVCYNNDYRKPGYIPVYEANSGAVCGAWWYSVYDFPNEKVHICPDGAPGGYRVLEVSNGKLSWYYKGTGRDASYQMRTYDRNSICLSADKYTPNANAANRQGFAKLAADYVNPSTANEVLINIWDWDPSWKISVTENGKSLSVKQTSGCLDPLYLASVEAYSFNKGYTTEYTAGTLSSYYPASTTSHIFKVQASQPGSTLEINITDRFGRSYHQTMTRPKAFKIEY